jgi:aldehyde:ferredoxin oxidoreductase
VFVDRRIASDGPSVARIDLGNLAPGRAAPLPLDPWRGSSPGIHAVGRWSGTALAFALLHESATARPDAPAPLVLAIGDAVRRALPTAARATVATRSPLSGLPSDGQVGSDLGRRVARIADAIVLDGSTDVSGAVLVLTGDARGDAKAELRSFPEISGATPGEVHLRIVEAIGACATLRTGRAGAAGIPFACLAAGDDPPSFVGRGGFGAVLGRLGLTAIAVLAAPVEPDPEEDFGGLARLLARSPRLRARAAGGTFEVAEALALGGSLRGLDAGAARTWSEGVAGSATERKGCEGCPTPCGLVFEHGYPGGARRAGGARFGATFALGPGLGLERPEDALSLLRACDDLALDAVETGAVLGLLAKARGEETNARDALLARIDDLVARRGDGEILALGAVAAARALGLEHELRSDGGAVRGQAARADRSLAAVLGQSVGARGADPMRTQPFLLTDAPASRLAEMLAPIPIPEGGADPRDPRGKGRIVWWHENWMAAIDTTGFCAFSAAGLLADGVATIDELAAVLAPPWIEARSGRALLAAGASIVAVARDLARRYGARAPEIHGELAHPGMYPEYAALRGLDTSGGPSEATWSSLGAGSILDVGTLREPPTAKPARRAPGRVSLRGSGPLARALGAGAVDLDIDLPASLREVLAAAASARPNAAPHLVRDGEPVPAAFLRKRRLQAEDLLRDGDEIDLVVALSGGAPLS